jgi:hypothetical protein
MVFMVFHISIAFSVESFTDTKYKKFLVGKVLLHPSSYGLGFYLFRFGANQ